MSREELRAYILENRGNAELLDKAITESISRPGWTEVSANLPIEEQLNIFGQVNSKKK